MNIKDRFTDYWNTDLTYDDYKYDLSVFEQIIYGITGVIGAIIGYAILFVALPIWGIPYLIYKQIKIKSNV